MDNLEKVEKLREKTGVSYEEAKEALEANNNNRKRNRLKQHKRHSCRI